MWRLAEEPEGEVTSLLEARLFLISESDPRWGQSRSRIICDQFLVLALSCLEHKSCPSLLLLQLLISFLSSDVNNTPMLWRPQHLLLAHDLTVPTPL